MGSIERTVAQLRSLPPASQGQVEEYIHQLHAATRAERLEALKSTAGCLTKEEADTLEQIIQKCCEVVDE